MLKRAVFAVIIGLAGCAQPGPPPPPAAASAGPAAATPTASGIPKSSYDGLYDPVPGSGSAPRCPTRITAPLRVQDGIASMQVPSAGTVQGPVSPNGSVTVQTGRNELAGTFVGTSFTGALTTANCRHELEYARR